MTAHTAKILLSWWQVQLSDAPGADLVVHGEMPESTQKGLVEGEWDALRQLLDGRDAVARLAKCLPGAIKAA